MSTLDRRAQGSVCAHDADPDLVVPDLHTLAVLAA